jgi:hypothetical protein
MTQELPTFVFPSAQPASDSYSQELFYGIAIHTLNEQGSSLPTVYYLPVDVKEQDIRVKACTLQKTSLAMKDASEEPLAIMVSQADSQEARTLPISCAEPGSEMGGKYVDDVDAEVDAWKGAVDVAGGGWGNGEK